ncbi:MULTISPECIES: thiolase family protein [Rhodococcus]|uniref:Thiolase family protein n=1 Tax=Rhodococcus opacus TaxID=37919 RepID=A0AAX3YEI6_RHOOP|nr:thiolase family protein [Rhodococcus opacus]NHU41904.1 thiolase family protein [Rhodococcus sp. A14]MCZ4586725.1 thiolase family protein [Rhodococcus opacus]MDV6243540.1 thiolase family protein [Rhodococcus opacus]QZS58747.1 thiolase family protein [Rhodococcus opacus]RKM74669.1 acetyl-CoA C-acyltransferase [Rhodococcus opacus]
MRDAVIVEAVRSPIGRRKGGLAEVHPVDLSATVLTALLDRAGVEPGTVDDVVWGCVGQVGEQAGNIARNAVLAAGWPESVPGTTIERQCGSSQQALHFAAAGVMSGQYDIVVAGGVESMTRIPMGSARRVGLGDPNSDAIRRRYEGIEFNQGRGAEILADRYELSRGWLDEYSLRSHRRAAAAVDEGRFAGEIVPVTLPDGTKLDADEGIRRSTTLEKLAQLEAAFGEDGRITAGNASQISDGAAALLVMSGDRARDLGLIPLARVHTATVVGDDPVAMLAGPIPATARVLDRAGLTLDDIGAFEVNEAFASVVGAWLRATGAPEERVNVLGGAIALGHPLGGSGARLATTLVHHLRAEGVRYGLQTMCEGGGMANATIFENLAVTV